MVSTISYSIVDAKVFDNQTSKISIFSFIIRSYGMSPENHRNVIFVVSFFSNELTSRKPLILSIKYRIAVVDKDIFSLENKLILYVYSSEIAKRVT